MKLYSSLVTEYAQEPRDNSSPVTWSELSELRNHLDELWKKLGVDITFTNHFFDRVNDPRNKKQITIGELSKLFSETYSKHGHNISMKVKPGSDNEFEAVITDLSTKVNLPFVLEWDRKRQELRLVAKTVMLKNDFKTPDQRFVVQQYEPQGTVMTEKKMKTYKDIKEWVGWNTPEVAPIATPQAVDDVDSAAFSVEKPEILEKLNAYCHDIANHQYINPYYPLNTLYKKLMLVGINFDLKKILMTGEQGRVEVPLSMFGGRFGVLGAPGSFVSSDDGITNRVPGGLNLVVTYQKTGGVYTLDATIQRGVLPGAVGFGEEVVSEGEDFNQHSDCGNCGRESVWTNARGVCKDCVSKEPAKKEVKKKVIEREISAGLTSHLPTLRRKKVVETQTTFSSLRQKLTTKEDIDTAGVPDAVPDFDMAETGGDVVPQIGVDDRLFTELDAGEDELNKKLVPSDTAVSGRLYTV